MKLRQILIGIFIITSFSCYNALEDVYKEANLNPASLESLDVFPGLMSPAFDSDTTSYSVSVENGYSSVTVTPEAVDRGASLQYCIDSGFMTPCVSGSGITVNSLAVGTPKVLAIEVIASGGSVKKTYTVSITRQGSADATLSGLSVSAGTLNSGFSPATMSYALSVPNANTSVNITPVVNTPPATLRYRIDSGLWNTGASGSPVTVGSLAVNVTKTLYVEVTAQNGTTVKTYNVAVTRLGENNANLSGISLSAGTLTPAFSAATTGYTVSVSGGVTSITVTPTTASTLSTLRYRIDSGSWSNTTSGAWIAVGSLVAGVPKTLYVEVTAQDGITVKIYNVVVIRESGSAIWARSVTLGSNSSQFNSVTTDSSGNVYAAGSQRGSGIFTYGTGVSVAGGSYGAANVLLVKYNNSGTAQWARSVTSGPEYGSFYSTAIDSSGNVYAVGFQAGTGTYTYGVGVTATGTYTYSNAVLVKYNSTGTALWARTVSTGSSDSHFNSVAVDSSGNIYTAGHQNGTVTYTYGTGVSVTGTSSSANIVLVKYNSSGTALWARSVTSGTSASCYRSISVDSSGNVYAAGYQRGPGLHSYGSGVSATSPSNNNDNVLIVKYDSNGTALWARTVSTGSSYSYFESVAADSIGNVYAAGNQEDTGTYTYGTGVSAAGTSASFNVVLVKYNSSGTAQWARTVISGLYENTFYSVKVNSSDSIYASGHQMGTDTFTYGNGVSIAGIGMGYNAVLVKYNSSGTAQWARTVTAGNSSSLFYSIAVDSSGSAYTAGYQNGTGAFTYGTGVSATGTYTGSNVVLVKYSE